LSILAIQLTGGKMKNCLTYAMKKWINEGGYLLIRRSCAFEAFGVKNDPWYSLRRLVWFVPHFLHCSYEGEITQFLPTAQQLEKDKKCLLRFFLSLWRFDGTIVKGDQYAVKTRLSTE
jgi:hypothetical protein